MAYQTLLPRTLQIAPTGRTRYRQLLACCAAAGLMMSGCTSTTKKPQYGTAPPTTTEKLSAMGASVGNSVKAGGTKLASAFKPKSTSSSTSRSDSSSSWWPWKKDDEPGADFYVSLAQVHEQSGNDNGAAEQYERALDKDPKFLPALVGYAHVLDRQGHKVKATDYYLRAVKVAPKDASVANDLGLCYARQGRFDEALEYLEKAVELKPDRDLYRNNIGTLLVELGRPDEAVQQISAVYGEPIARYNVGVLLKQQGKWQDASRQLALAVEKDPGLQEARELLDELTGQSQPREQIASASVIEKTSSVEVDDAAAVADEPTETAALPEVVVRQPTRVAARLPSDAPVKMTAPASTARTSDVPPAPEQRVGRVMIQQQTIPASPPPDGSLPQAVAQPTYTAPSRY